MINSDTTFLDDDELYDLIVEVVGDDTSHEYCALYSYYVEDNTLTAATRSFGVSATDLEPHISEIEQLATERTDNQS